MNNSIKLSAKKGDDMNLDDKQIESMLKDPAFANIAGDLEKLKTSRAQMEATGKELKGMGVDPLTHKKVDAGAKPDAGGAGAAKPAEKDPLAGLSAKELADLGVPPAVPGPGGAAKDPLAGLAGLGGAAKDPLAGLAGLGGADPMKDLGLGSDMGGAAPAPHPTPAAHKSSEDDMPKDKFKDFDFISKQQARLLLEVLKQPTFFHMLPKEAQQIVKVK